MSGKDRDLGSHGWPGELGNGNVEPSAVQITGAPQDADQHGPLQGPGQRNPGRQVPAGPGGAGHHTGDQHAGEQNTSGQNTSRQNTSGQSTSELTGQAAKPRKGWWWLVLASRPTGQSGARHPAGWSNAGWPSERHRTGRSSAEQPGAEQPGAEQPGAEQPGAEQPRPQKPRSQQPRPQQPSAAQPTQQSGGEANPGWAIISYLVAGMAFYGSVGWLISLWIGHSAVLVPVGLLAGLGLALTMIILRYGRS
jgi:ATP synthase protein I